MRNLSTIELRDTTGLPPGSLGILRERIPPVVAGDAGQHPRRRRVVLGAGGCRPRVGRGLRENGYAPAVCWAATSILAGFTERGLALELRRGKTHLPIVPSGIITRLVEPGAITNNPHLYDRTTGELLFPVNGIDIARITKNLFDRITEADARAKGDATTSPSPSPEVQDSTD